MPPHSTRRRPSAAEPIVIAPPEVASRIAEALPARAVLAFSSVDEFERWRVDHCDADRTLRTDVEQALHELQCAIDRLPAKLRRVLESLEHRTDVPALLEMTDWWPSRRSFYRTWSAHFECPPSRFLGRIRTLHAARLLQTGLPAKEVAYKAGFSSVDQMRRHVGRRS